MTLGAWFRDYVYIPMGGNRVKPFRWYINLLTVWFLTGLWHGAGWNFICWGLFFGMLLILEKNLGKKTSVFSHIYVVIAIIISFLIFHAENMEMAFRDIKALLPGATLDKTQLEIAGYMLRNRLGILIIAILGATPLPSYLWNLVFRLFQNEVLEEMVKAVGIVVIMILSTAYLIDGSFNPFLYFRF